MGSAIDATAIQFKLLNRSRGPAVWSPRAQADKRRYGACVRAALEREPRISWIVGKAGGILVENGRVAGLAMTSSAVANKANRRAHAVICRAASAGSRPGHRAAARWRGWGVAPEGAGRLGTPRERPSRAGGICFSSSPANAFGQ